MVDRAYAESAPVSERQVAVNVAMLFLFVGVEIAPFPDLSWQNLGVDCQAVVQGFAKRTSLADDYRSYYALGD